jgi:hypothetical protein
MFASKLDIQAWLQSDKITVDDANSNKPNIEAERLIKGQLSGLFAPVTLSSWADPTTTPETIRSIAGRLTAAFMYRTIYSEESDTIPEYAQSLYNEAIGMLQDIKSGSLVVLDDTDTPVDTSGSNILSFWPDNTTLPVFTMDQTFA